MTNTKFITNQEGNTLARRLETLLVKDTENLSILVGYFYLSGFFQISNLLENIKEIRILVGLSTDPVTAELIAASKQITLDENLHSSVQKKEALRQKIVDEIAKAEDKKEVEEGILKFIEWAVSGKLKVKYYEKSPLHAKMYVMTFDKEDRNRGHVITGSSNLSQSGLSDNLELNVELRDDADHDFALDKFNELWNEATDITEFVVGSVKDHTHLNTEITPYDVYMKFLYEYFRKDLELEDTIGEEFLPEGYINLQYQKQAVLSAQKILEEHHGIFISDVVGLGKTYTAARLAALLGGRKLVLASPKLLDQRNPGSWKNAFRDFGVRGADFESIGKLSEAAKKADLYEYVFIDESHTFRNELTESYALLHQICFGKKVILVSATPYNNRISDIKAQVGLFQDLDNSTIPGIRNLNVFFKALDKKIQSIDRRKDEGRYRSVIKDSSEELRERVLRHIMIRRTRSEIKAWFEDDMEEQGLNFPDINGPDSLYYFLDKDEDKIFSDTILRLREFKYAFYKPLAYLKTATERDKLSQENSAGFMRAYVVKRFESSVYAFGRSIDRFIDRHQKAIENFEIRHEVYVTNKLADKINQLLDADDSEEIDRLIENDQAEKHEADEFRVDYIDDLKKDLETLQQIQLLWRGLKRDAKLEEFKEELKNKIKPSSTNKIIIFTESKETAEYLGDELNELYKTFVFTGASHATDLDKVIANFDAKSRERQNDIEILVATDVLSEGVNLHQSCCVINYDLPWNPTKLIQRVGRIDRVDTRHKELFVYNLFPTVQGNSEIFLKETAQAKITAIIELLGNDSKLLTEDETIKSNELFYKLQDKKTLTGEDEDSRSELDYLKIIQKLRDEDTKEFSRIRDLPKKLRVGRANDKRHDELAVFFKRGEENTFVYLSQSGEEKIGFFETADLLRAEKGETPRTIHGRPGIRF